MGRTIERGVVRACLVALATIVAACGDPTVLMACTPGDRVACTTDGSSGTARCLPGGELGICEVAGMVDAGPPPFAPEPSAPPAWRCPSGWVEASVGGVTTCAPWASAPICDPPLARLPGEPACVTIGGACPTGDLPDVVVPGAVHVLIGAAGGDGSRAMPFGTLAEALAVLADGGTLLVGKGTYEETLLLPPGVTVRGACARETTIRTALSGTTSAAVDVTGPDTVLENLRVETDRDVGVRVRPDAGVRISGIWIDGADTAVLGFGRAMIELEDVLITDAYVAGVHAPPGVTATVRRTSFLGVDEVAVRCTTGSTVVVEDISVDGLVDTGDANAFFVEEGATLTARRFALTDGVGYAVTALGPSSHVVLEDFVIADGLSVSTGGVRILNGASVEFRRGSIEGMRAFAIGAVDADTELLVEDVVVAGTRLLPGDPSTSALEVVSGASAELIRVSVVDNEGIGVLVHGADTTLRAIDLRVASTSALSTTLAFGRGLQVQAFGAADLTRAAFDMNREVGVMVSTDATLTGTEVSISDTLARACAETSCADSPGGSGLVATQRGTVTLARFAIDGSPLCGVQLAAAAEMDLDAGTVRRSVIGACVQVDGYDLDRLSSGVAYRENGVNLDATTLPVPDAVTTVD